MQYGAWSGPASGACRCPGHAKKKDLVPSIYCHPLAITATPPGRDRRPTTRRGVSVALITVPSNSGTRSTERPAQRPSGQSAVPRTRRIPRHHPAGTFGLDRRRHEVSLDQVVKFKSNSSARACSVPRSARRDRLDVRQWDARAHGRLRRRALRRKHTRPRFDSSGPRAVTAPARCRCW